MDIHEVRIGSLRRFHLRHRHENDSLRPYALEDNGLHVGFSENIQERQMIHLTLLSNVKNNLLLIRRRLFF